MEGHGAGRSASPKPAEPAIYMIMIASEFDNSPPLVAWV